MNRKNLAALVHAVVETTLERRAAIPDRPVTFDTLSIDFDAREVLFRGRLIKVQPGQALDIPLVSTDHLVVGAVGTTVI